MRYWNQFDVEELDAMHGEIEINDDCDIIEECDVVRGCECNGACMDCVGVTWRDFM